MSDEISIHFTRFFVFYSPLIGPVAFSSLATRAWLGTDMAPRWDAIAPSPAAS